MSIRRLPVALPIALALASLPALAAACGADGPYRPGADACAPVAQRAPAPLLPLAAPPALPSLIMEMGRPGPGGSFYQRAWWTFDLADIYGTMQAIGGGLPVVDAWDLSVDLTTSWYIRVNGDWGTQWPDTMPISHGGLSEDPIDPATTSLVDLAIDPRSGAGFVAAIRNDNATNTAWSELYSFDTEIGALRYIGAMSDTPSKVSALAMSCGGVLYGYDGASNRLGTIDTATGWMTPLGQPSGQVVSANNLQSLAFDRRDGTLYGMLFLSMDNGDNVFGRFAADGRFEAIAPLEPPSPQPGIFRIKLPTPCADEPDDTLFADGFEAPAVLR